MTLNEDEQEDEHDELKDEIEDEALRWWDCSSFLGMKLAYFIFSIRLSPELWPTRFGWLLKGQTVGY